MGAAKISSSQLAGSDRASLRSHSAKAGCENKAGGDRASGGHSGEPCCVTDSHKNFLLERSEAGFVSKWCNRDNSHFVILSAKRTETFHLPL
jgi:hypothetical protein